MFINMYYNLVNLIFKQQISNNLIKKLCKILYAAIEHYNTKPDEIQIVSI